VDLEKNVITLTIKTKVGGEDKMFNMRRDTKIVTAIYGVSLPASELTAEKEVILRLSTDQKAAVKITVLGL